ncbi:alpha-L-fucosidase [Portibacter lacus]|uniref:alpha-L-fucosidase n=2 Tax=Portibacter lacus TaxID=1099794 RepID=A0AA37SQW5_9BACT|nr:alpha-L-fucosidase [Portibacter lacus]GLR18998.1 alpha-L-fucosidase [Portibacter lacus]
MEWFDDAKLGIFIHYGVYSVNGIDESWSFFNNYISHEDYMDQLKKFNGEKYDATQWASLIKKSGAQYAVLTSKHHDGVALWDSEVGSLKTNKDYVAPFVSAIRNEGLKVGIYYSILDWSHPDYDVYKRNKKRYNIKEDPARWENFTTFNHGQIKELSDRFNPDLWWFDGDWEHSAAEWKAPEIKSLIQSKNPNAIINSRLTNQGDYDTPEQGVPLTSPENNHWELCLTSNDSWGYQPNDKNYKTTNQVIRILVDCIQMGGNLLLDIGPKPDGTIPEEQVEILEGVGRWMNKHKGDVYDMQKGIPPGYYYGATALSRDSTILYLFLDYNPNEEIVIKGLENEVNRVWVVGNGTKLRHRVMSRPYWSNKPGLLYIDVPDDVLDKDVTVLALLLDGKIKLE